jgi:hypothetical protein
MNTLPEEMLQHVMWFLDFKSLMTFSEIYPESVLVFLLHNPYECVFGKPDEIDLLFSFIDKCQDGENLIYKVISKSKLPPLEQSQFENIIHSTWLLMKYFQLQI